MKMIEEYENLKNSCRICLEKRKVLVLISNHLNSAENNSTENLENPLISSALSDIMSEEIDNNHPKGICLPCLMNLRSAYNLKLQFRRSQQVLRKYEKLLIESYKEDDLFEVYDSDIDKHEIDDYVENISITNHQTSNIQNSVMIPEYFDNSPDRKSSDVLETIESSNYKRTYFKTEIENPPEILENEEHNTEQGNFTIPVKITKLKNNDKNRNDVQVRCVDVNKYIIEKKSSHGHNKNLDNLQHNLSSDMEKISSKRFEDEGTSNESNSRIKCPSCEKLYSKGRFEKHVLICKSSNSSTYQCNECHREFRKIKNLNFHIKLKHSTNPFPCKICGVVFENYHAKQIHMREEHGTGKSFKCDFCNKGFYFNAALLKHKSKHTRETQEVCNICGKTFHYKGALFYHMKMHTNERKYLCTFCDKNFYTSQSLQRHTDTHTGARRFKCNFCDKSFRSSSERRRHEMLHTGERPHHCDYCDKGFTSRYNLNIHTAAHRGTQQCIFCTRQFLNEKVLQLHIKFKHRV